MTPNQLADLAGTTGLVGIVLAGLAATLDRRNPLSAILGRLAAIALGTCVLCLVLCVKASQ